MVPNRYKLEKKGKHLKNLLLHQMISISRMPSANFTNKTKCSSQKFKEIICKYTLGKWVPIRLSTYLLFSTFCNRMENQGKEDYVPFIEFCKKMQGAGYVSLHEQLKV